MERRNFVKKKQQNTASSDDGFSSLMDAYIHALEDNSNIITDMLEELSKRELSEADKNELKQLDKGLAKLDKQLNKLGK